jgi:phage-related minor tail protein
MSLDLGELVARLSLDDDKLDKGLDKAEGKFKSAGKTFAKIGLGLGVAAAGALTAGLVSGMDVQSARAQLSAQLGLTGQDSKRIGGAAGALFAQAYGDSLEDVNDAVASVVQNISGMRTASAAQLQGVTKDVLNFSDAFGVDAAESTKAVSTILKTGLAPDAQTAFDVLTKGMQSGVNKADDLLDTFTEYPTEFRKLGLDAQTAMGLLQQGLQGGARDSDKVADALKEFSIRAVDGSKTTAAGFKAIGLDADKMAAQIGKGGKSAADGLQLTLDKLKAIKDPVARSQAAVNLFGTQAEDLGAALYALDPSHAVQAIGETAGSAKQLGDTLRDTAKTHITEFKRQLKSTFVNLVGGKVVPMVTKLTGWLSKNLGPAIGKITDWLKDNQDIVKPLVAALAGAVGIILAIAGALKVWSAIQAILNAELLANPIVLIVAGLAALAVGLVYAYKHSEKFRKVVHDAFAVVKKVASALVDFFTGPFLDFFTKTLPGALKTFAGYFTTAWDNIKQVASTFVDFFTKTIPGAFQSVIDWVRSHWQLLAQIAISILLPGGVIIAAVWHFKDDIIGGFQAAWDGVKAGISKFVGFFTDTIPAAVNSVIDWVKDHWALIVSIIGGPIGAAVAQVITHWDDITGAFKAGWDTVKRVTSGAVDKVVGFFTGIWGRISGGLRDLGTSISGKFTAVTTWVSNLPGKLASAGTAMWSWILDEFKDAWLKVSSWFGTMLSWVGGFGGDIKDVVVGMWDGLKEAAKAAFNFVADIWNNTVGKLSFHIPGWVPKIGGKGFDVPDIPHMYAAGGNPPVGVPAIVGEEGPELFVPRRPGTIIPAGLSRQLLQATTMQTAAGEQTITIELTSRDPLMQALLALVDGAVASSNRSTTSAALAGAGRRRMA